MVITLRELELFEQEYLMESMRGSTRRYGEVFLERFPELSAELYSQGDSGKMTEALIHSTEDVAIVSSIILEQLMVIK